MRGLTVILTRIDAAEAALTLLMAQAALGGRARLFALGPAVAALRPSPLLDEATALAVALFACQSGLADTGLAIEQLVGGTEAAGPVAILAGLDDDRLVTL